MKKTISLVFVLVLGLATEVAKADFTFGEPTPVLNVSTWETETGSSISADGLELYFYSERPGGYGGSDLYVAKRQTTYDDWGPPVNLGPAVNSPHGEYDPIISGDGLTLYFSDGLWDVQRPRPGGFGGGDIWATRRETLSDPWGVPENLGEGVNSSATEGGPSISSDGLSLFFECGRPGGSGSYDIWMTSRVTPDSEWGPPVNLGPVVNSSALDVHPDISADGLALYFQSDRSGTHDLWVTTRAALSDPFGLPVHIGPMIKTSGWRTFPNISADGRMLYFTHWPTRTLTYCEIWQVLIEPAIDFNGDGIVDSIDMYIMVDYWGTDEPLCDIGPTPLGDGIVDVQDLIILAEHLFEEVDDPTLMAHWALDEIEGDIASDSANDNDGNVYGDPAWQPEGGMIDGALQLDGIDDYISTPLVLNPADGNFSVFIWIKGGATGQVVVAQKGGVNWLCIDPLEANLMTELKASGRGAAILPSQAVITDGNWHRIGLVWDGSHRTLYVDGVAVAEDTQTNLEGSDSGLYLGCSKAMEPGTYWSGLIDDVRIYNRAVRP